MIETISSKKSSNENCPEHKIPLLYYCIQCLEPLCSDCFMFGKKHKDHEIKHLDIIYKNHLELIKNETKDLQSKLDNLNNILLNIEEKISLIKHAKQERSLEQDELFDNLKKKYENNNIFIDSIQ